MSETLYPLACPFEAGHAKDEASPWVGGDGHHLFRVRCECGGHGPAHSTKELAVAAWNAYADVRGKAANLRTGLMSMSAAIREIVALCDNPGRMPPPDVWSELDAIANEMDAAVEKNPP